MTVGSIKGATPWKTIFVFTLIGTLWFVFLVVGIYAVSWWGFFGFIPPLVTMALSVVLLLWFVGGVATIVKGLIG